MKSSVGAVRHLGTCMVNVRLGHHFVVSTPEGEATLILLHGKGKEVASPQTSQGPSVLIIGLLKGRVGMVSKSPD
ncbi:MAG: hypothetical protein FJY37_14320 [Betaproteobacteria bacterium]|nr:hypothetical protein [Betaproteobacteria bacterium]